jgi:hypothetical protein
MIGGGTSEYRQKFHGLRATSNFISDNWSSFFSHDLEETQMARMQQFAQCEVMYEHIHHCQQKSIVAIIVFDVDASQQQREQSRDNLVPHKAVGAMQSAADK